MRSGICQTLKYVSTYFGRPAWKIYGILPLCCVRLLLGLTLALPRRLSSRRSLLNVTTTPRFTKARTGFPLRNCAGRGRTQEPRFVGAVLARAFAVGLKRFLPLFPFGPFVFGPFLLFAAALLG